MNKNMTAGQRFVVTLMIVVSVICLGVWLKIYFSMNPGAVLEERLFWNAISLIPLGIMSICITIIFIIVMRKDSK